MRLARPAAAFALCAAVAPAQLRADTPLLDLLTVELVARGLVQAGIGVLRNQFDVEYERLDILDGGERFVMTGVALYPPSPDPTGDKDCVVEVAELELVNGWEGDKSWTRLRAHGAEATLGCLPREASAPMSALGYDALRFERAEIDLDYDFGPSALELRATLAATDAATAVVDARFDYVWVLDAGLGAPEPAVWMRDVAVTLEDRGLASRLRAMIEAQGEDVAAVRARLSAGVRAGLSQGGSLPLYQRERDFADALSAALDRLLTQGGAAGILARPEDGVWLGEDDFGGPSELLAALQPQVFLGALPPPAEPGPDASVMRRVLAGESATVDERREVGRALLDGRGAPRAVEAGLDLLEPLARDGDAAAAALAADALADRSPVSAYRYALLAPGADAPALLDRLERRLSLEEALSLQAEASPDAAPPQGGASAWTQAALAAAEGRERPRDYARAWLWSSVAAAAGDRAAERLRDRLSDRLSRFDAERWERLEARLAGQAVDLWLDDEVRASLRR